MATINREEITKLCDLLPLNNNNILKKSLVDWVIWVQIEPVLKDYLTALIETGLNTYWINPVTFVIEQCPRKKSIHPIEEVEIDDKAFDLLFPLLCESYDGDRIVLPLVEKLTVENIYHKPSSSSMGGAGYWVPDDFKYVWTVQNPNGIQFKQLIEAVFRVKRNKYDLWYEVFSGIDQMKWINDNHLYLVLDLST